MSKRTLIFAGNRPEDGAGGIVQPASRAYPTIKMYRIRKPEGWLSRGTRVRVLHDDWLGKIKGYGMTEQPTPCPFYSIAERFYLIDVGPRDVWARPTEIEVIDR